MKILIKTFSLTLLASFLAYGNTAKVSEPTKKVYQVLEGNSMKDEAKKGLAVDINYTSEHVEVGEMSDVHITVLTHLDKGTLKVALSSLENNLEGIEKEQYSFELVETTEKNQFPINLQVKSEKEGIHYLSLSFSLEGEGSRVIAVPVNVGDVSKVMQQKALQKSANGDVISVSRAVEEIK